MLLLLAIERKRNQDRNHNRRKNQTRLAQRHYLQNSLLWLKLLGRVERKEWVYTLRTRADGEKGIFRELKGSQYSLCIEGEMRENAELSLPVSKTSSQEMVEIPNPE